MENSQSVKTLLWKNVNLWKPYYTKKSICENPIMEKSQSVNPIIQKRLKNLVVARSAGALDALMAEQVEVSLSGVVDAWNNTVKKILKKKRTQPR